MHARNDSIGCLANAPFFGLQGSYEIGYLENGGGGDVVNDFQNSFPAIV